MHVSWREFACGSLPALGHRSPPKWNGGAQSMRGSVPRRIFTPPSTPSCLAQPRLS